MKGGIKVSEEEGIFLCALSVDRSISKIRSPERTLSKEIDIVLRHRKIEDISVIERRLISNEGFLQLWCSTTHLNGRVVTLILLFMDARKVM